MEGAIVQLSEKFVNSTMKKIKQELSFVYENLPKRDNLEDFDEFLLSIINEIMIEIDNLMEVTYDNVYIYQKRRATTKKRWYKKEIDEEVGLYKEVNIVAKTLFEDTLKGDIETFYQIYKCNTPDDLRELRLKELESWMKDDSTPLSHFKYIKDKTQRQIISALSNDIKYMFYKEIYEKCPKGKHSNISTLPISISNIPIDFTNRAKMNTNNVIDDGKEKYFLDKYQISDTRILESRMNVEALKRGMVKEVLKWLNAKDIEIFNYCMSVALVDEDFYRTRQIIVDIGDIVRNVYPGNDSSDSYRSVKESLYRMQYLNSGIVDESLRGFTTKLLDNVEIFPNSNGKETAQIFVNIHIMNQYIQNNTISNYSDVINNFKLSTSKIGIYSIQRERIRIATSQPDAEELIFETNYNFFRGIFLFSNKRKRKNIETIEKMLDEIVENEIAIKSFERKGDKFTLVFYPISEQERKDLINQTVFDPVKLEEDNQYFLENPN